MSYSYTQRKKTICRLKQKIGKGWSMEYHHIVQGIRDKQSGPFIGNLQEIMDAHTEDFIYMDAEPVANVIKEIMDTKRGAIGLQTEGMINE